MRFFYANFLNMIYKFETTPINLEVSQYGDYTKSKVSLKLYDFITPDDYVEIVLDSDQLYNLIGSLHSIQTKIKKGGSYE
jgi:hypothetical protein